MQFYLTVIIVVLVILEVTLGSVSGEGCKVDAFISERGLKPNDVNVYVKRISQASYKAVFNISGENKTLFAGSTNLVLITNKSENKWTTFIHSEALFRFILGSPIKIMMYCEQGIYQEKYLGDKWITPTACQNITCEPYISIPAYSYHKKESFLQQDCDKYTLYGATLVPFMETLSPQTFEDNRLPFLKEP